MSTSPFDDDDGISQAERHLFSLYAQYPEIDFDDSEETTASGELTSPERGSTAIDSSPLSTTIDESQTTFCSNSTAQTTPLRHLVYQARDFVDRDTVEGYLHLIQHTDLPGHCLQYFTRLAQSINTISSGFAPSSSGRYRINNTFFVDACQELLRDVQSPLDRTTEQIQQLARLKSLVIFQVTPTDDCLWSTYRQRAQLIIKSTSLPSATEKRLIHRLARVYNACVYQPFQHLVDAASSSDHDAIEDQPRRLLNRLYDALFTWLARYTRWCDAMRDLRQRHVQPLTARILASPRVVAETRQGRRVRDVAQAAIDTPRAPGVSSMDERALMALNLSARRRDANASASASANFNARRPKRRYRREQTI